MSLDHTITLPLISISLVGILVLVSECLLRKAEPISYWISILGLAGTGLLMFPGLATVTGLPAVTSPGGLFCLIIVVAALLTVIFSRDYLRRSGGVQGEYYLMVLFSVGGMMLMAVAKDLVMLFLGLELMSICLYVLAGYIRKRVTGNEASLKYFLLGAFISGFILYGIALVYGTTGSLSIDTLVALMQAPGQPLLFWAGTILILGGFAFKVGAFPFHMWIPDVYQGAPTPVTAFMATGAKTAAFSVLIIVFSRRAAVEADQLREIVAFLAAGSMIIGNILALAQQNVKRMLAYSSIAHAGYMLIGIAAGSDTGRDGVSYYLISYLFMNLGAWGIVSVLEEKEERNLTVGEFAGLSRKNPFLAGLMAMFLFSLAGLPPFGGFFGKYFVFVSAIESGLTWLAILGVLASLAGLYYYLRLVMVMFFQESDRPAAEPVPSLALAALAAAAAVNLQTGVLPSSIIALINNFR